MRSASTPPRTAELSTLAGRPSRWWRPGLHHCYPPEHEQLYDELVAKGGALVSPFELESHATLRSFHLRNGVLAALTQATVVVQAPVKSGARSTAKHARRLGRPLFVTPASPWDLQGEGNLLELRLGALLLTDPERAVRSPRRPACRGARCRDACERAT